MTVWKWVVAAGGWVVALLLLPGYINSFYDEGPKALSRLDNTLLVDHSLSGKWSSEPEGDVIAKSRDPKLDALDGAPVEMELYVRRFGWVEGVIGSGGLGESYVFSQLPVAGRKSSGTIEAVAWDAIGGKKEMLGAFRLEPGERDNEPILNFILIGQRGDFFPEKAILWRTEQISEGAVNTRYICEAIGRAC